MTFIRMAINKMTLNMTTLVLEIPCRITTKVAFCRKAGNRMALISMTLGRMTQLNMTVGRMTLVRMMHSSMIAEFHLKE
jgi:hypothetical protein